MADQFRPQGVDPLVDRIAEPDRTGLDLLTTGIESVNQQGFQSYLEDRQDQRTEQTIEGQRSIQADALMDERASEYRSAAQAAIDSTYEALALLDPNDPENAEVYDEGRAFIARLNRVIAGTYQAATPEELRGVIAEGADLLSDPVAAEVRSRATQSQWEREDAVSERAHANAVQILEITQEFQGNQNELNRELQVLLTEMNINSAEEIAALDRELRQQEVAHNIDLSWAQHALAERAQDLAERAAENGELDAARNIYELQLDLYAGRMDEPGAREAVNSILQSAAASLGTDSRQYRSLVSFAENALTSGAAVEALDAERVERRQAQVDLAMAEQELDQARYDFAVGVTQDEFDMRRAAREDLRAAVESGRPWEVEAIAAEAAYNPFAYLGVRFEDWVDEDGQMQPGLLTLARERQAELAKDRDLAQQQVQATLNRVVIGNVASRNGAADSIAQTLYRIEDDAELEARLASIRRDPNFGALGGEAFIDQIRLGIGHYRILEEQDAQLKRDTMVLQNPVDSDDWERDARAIYISLGYEPNQAANLAMLGRQQGRHAGLSMEIANRALINQLLGKPEPMTIEERKHANDLAQQAYENEDAIIRAEFADCLQDSDSIERVSQLTCPPPRAAEMVAMMRRNKGALDYALNSINQGVPMVGSLETFSATASFYDDSPDAAQLLFPGTDITSHLPLEDRERLAVRFVTATGFHPPDETDAELYPGGESDPNYIADEMMWLSEFAHYVSTIASGGEYVYSNPGIGARIAIDPPEEGSSDAEILLQAQADWVAGITAAAGEDSERPWGFPARVSQANEAVGDFVDEVRRVRRMATAALGADVVDGARNVLAWLMGDRDALVDRRNLWPSLFPGEEPPEPAAAPDFSRYSDRTAESFASVSSEAWHEVRGWVDGSDAAKAIADTMSEAGFTITSSPTTRYTDGRIHHGIDISSGRGKGAMTNSFFNQPVTIVSTRVSEGGLGNTIVVETESGLRFQIGHIDDEDWDTDFYAVGKTINPGEPLAREGNTGWTEGPTGVHFDIQWVDHENRPFSNREGVENHATVDQITMALAYVLAPRDILEQTMVGAGSGEGR